MLEKALKSDPLGFGLEAAYRGFDSYRGYYDRLALEPGSGIYTAGLLLDDARRAVGASFTGYKGGRFRMDESTPVYIALYGCLGPRLAGIQIVKPGGMGHPFARVISITEDD